MQSIHATLTGHRHCYSYSFSTRGARAVFALALASATGTALAADLHDWNVRGGALSIHVNGMTAAGLDLELCSTCAADAASSTAPWTIVEPVTDGSRLMVDLSPADPQLVTADVGISAGLVARGALRSARMDEMRITSPPMLDNPTLWVTSAADPTRPALIIRDYDFRLNRNTGQALITSEAVTLSPEWAKRLGLSGYEHAPLARVVVELDVEDADGIGPAIPDAEREAFADDFGSIAGTSLGPDVTVWALSGTQNYGCSGEFVPNPDPDPPDEIYVCVPDPETGEFISGFAIGTISCNVGDENLVWFANTDQHPVIAQNMYRLKSNRFEQIGMAWVKHGFFATDSNHCDTCSDVDHSIPGTYLAVGCSDLYSAGLNGNWAYLGPRSEINAHAGTNLGPPNTGQPSPDRAERRLQVENKYLYPEVNAGSRYFVEGHYVTPDDAAAENDNNNIAYKEVSVIQLDVEEFAISDGGPPSVTEQPAIRGWAATDPTVLIAEAQVPGEGLFVAAAKAIELPDSFYRYEYAVFNMNSDRSGGSFSVPLPDGAAVRNPGFHDARYHSGEPYDGTDWPATVENGRIFWESEPYATNENANALRWSTMYNFWFETNVPPLETPVTLGLFKPGTPESIDITLLAPATGVVDCNGNGVPDSCDLSCSGVGCSEPDCATSNDCNENLVPDECDADCNENGIPDSCDLSWATGLECSTCLGEVGTSNDCNANLVPDECEPDCDNDGIPNDCETITDTDGDGTDDCEDLCPTTTPEGICDCVPQCCCDSGICFSGLTPEACLGLGGGCAPVCQVPKCRDGCLLGDIDGDGDVDLADTAAFERCFSGDLNLPGFVAPGGDCLHRCDFDEDGDVDVEDYFIDTTAERYLFYDAFSGP